MTRKKISSGEQFTTGESSHAHNTTVSDTVDDTSTSCSQGHCIENLTDTLHCVGTQDEIRALEIQARRLEIEAKLLETREKLRLLKSNVKETDSILPEASSKTGALERVEPLEYVTFCDDMFSLPKTELSYFNGDPSQYWSFVTDFETNVARKVRDAGAKLTYLKYYCRGPAREAIEGCSMLPPEQGYKVALENLKSMFGDEHQVTRALLGTLKNEIKNVGDSPIRWQLLSIKFKDCKLAFDHMGNVEYLNAYETLESLIKCFSAEIREKWVKLSGKLKADGLVASFTDLIQLIEQQSNFRNNIYSHLTLRQKPEPNLNIKNVYLTAKVKANEFTLSCPMCRECHQLDECSKFMSSPPEVRLNLVKQKGRCYNCLKGKHLSKDCRLKKPCRSLNCNKYHHKLLHEALSFENKPDSKVVAVTTCECDVHLGVIPVKVQTPDGLIVTNALLDPGSQITLVKDSLASKLNTKCSDIRIKIATVSGSSIIDTNELQLSIQSLDGSELIEVGKAYVVPSLPFEMAPYIDRRNLENWEHLRDLDLPTTFNGDVTILIGSDVPEAHWILDQRIGGKKEPFAIRSKLGWILRGPINNSPSSSYASCVINQSCNPEKIIEHVYNHDFEDVTSSNLLSQDDIKAPDDQMVCNLVMAKAMVTPKTVSMPTLESTATTLVKSTFRSKWNSTKHFTDCKIIINYIRNTSSRLCTFVANKIAEIRNCFSPDQWNHMIEFMNPTDFASSGLRLQSSFPTEWFNGPKSLTQSESTWPVHPHDLPLDDHLIEFKSKAHVICTSICSPMNKLTTYFSCWLKVIKSAAWLIRFKQYIMIMYGKRNYGCFLDTGLLKVSEVKRAEHDVIRLIQRDSFSQELDLLTMCGNEGQTLPRSSRLHKLSPILIDDILHMNSRLRNSDFVVSFKLPIILPNDHPAIKTLVEYYHRLEGHSGTSQTLNAIRCRYWILKEQKTVRNIIVKCVKCNRLNGRPCTQLMAPLPSLRLETNDTPFSSVGVDYFGPFLVKRGRTLEKRYCCLFTCLKIRAVHLEITHSLSKESFLMAFARFCSRRGITKIVYSANGSNFIGAETELKVHLKNWSMKTINDKTLEYNIGWIFNPPECSHRGGIWERMIRSTRRILRAITNDQTLDDETFLTFVVEAEKIMNNRPLCQLSDDQRDNEVLTPNKILMLSNNDCQIKTDCSGNKYLRQWRRVCHLAQTFRKRWVKEYLSTLHTRQKWQQIRRILNNGDLVMVMSENISPANWPLGLVIDSKVSEDVLVREVTIKTSKGTVRKDVRKICLLEGKDDYE